jgi:D-glycero-beta-D-manno-heptose 1-phosphate adenylyltransferase
MDPMQQLQQKIIPMNAIGTLTRKWKQEEENIVFTNGCFDLIHRGHVDYLARAAGMGTKLIIGLNTDASVSRIKGSGRPFQDEISRAMVLASLFFTDAVVLFGEDTPYKLIREIIPDILVKGADYHAEDIVGYDLVTTAGGLVKTLDYLPGYSTTAIMNRIKQAQG